MKEVCSKCGKPSYIHHKERWLCQPCWQKDWSNKRISKLIKISCSNKYEKAILKLLYYKRMSKNIKEIARKTGISWATARKYITKLEQKGLINKNNDEYIEVIERSSCRTRWAFNSESVYTKERNDSNPLFVQFAKKMKIEVRSE